MTGSSDDSSQTVDVAIAGLGPTGLVLAHILGKRGHDVVVLEREPEFYGNARAVYTDDECMRVFQSIDAADELGRDMLVDTPVQLCRPDGSPMAQLRGMERRFGWPVVNFFYQPYMETKLADLLDRYPSVKVRRGRQLTGFKQDSRGVVVTHEATREVRFTDCGDAKRVRSIDVDEQTLSARYLVGADGGRSTVREILGIEMTGKSFPEPWLVVDLKSKNGASSLRHLPYFNFFCDPECPAVSCPQPDGHHRFEFRLRPGQTKEYMEKPETVRQYLSKYVDPDDFEVKRRLVYTFNALMAETWRKDRVFLAGDAAHMTPQFMGQGASSGIRDAFNLGWKLSAVLKDQASPSMLDTYENERRDHAKAMIDISVLMKDLVSLSNPATAAVRNLALRGVRSVPGLRAWFEEGRFRPKPIYRRGGFLGMRRRRRRGPEGAMAPQPEVRTIDGRRVLLDDLLGDGFSLIGQEVDPRHGLSKGSQAWLERIDTSFVRLCAYGNRPQGEPARRGCPGLQEVEEMAGDMLDWFKKAGFSSDGVALIRPDGFVFGLVGANQVDRAVAELQRQLQC
ncbi:MAG: bifunctional 3-(3-hydroxy-phenyl)propionate/3-hydroxycinnamic acid hydroxylase [Myxococcota bacterium]